MHLIKPFQPIIPSTLNYWTLNFGVLYGTLDLGLDLEINPNASQRQA